jgi:hypothetical protein
MSRNSVKMIAFHYDPDVAQFLHEPAQFRGRRQRIAPGPDRMRVRADQLQAVQQPQHGGAATAERLLEGALLLVCRQLRAVQRLLEGTHGERFATGIFDLRGQVLCHVGLGPAQQLRLDEQSQFRERLFAAAFLGLDRAAEFLAEVAQRAKKPWLDPVVEAPQVVERILDWRPGAGNPEARLQSLGSLGHTCCRVLDLLCLIAYDNGPVLSRQREFLVA